MGKTLIIAEKKSVAEDIAKAFGGGFQKGKTALESLGSVELSVKAAGDSGKLFGSVTAADVVAAIKKAGGPNLDKRTVQLPKAHIKSVGTHPIVVRLHPDVDAAVSLNVVAG